MINIIIGIISIILLYGNLKKVKITNRVATFIFIILVPFCVNIVDFISPNSKSGNLTIYACVMIFIIPILLLEKNNMKRVEIKKSIKWIAVICLIIIGVNNYYLNNIYYLKVSTYYKQTELFYNRLYSRIEEIDGFKPNMKIAVFEYLITEPGEYYAQCFVKDKDGNALFIQNTESIIID